MTMSEATCAHEEVKDGVSRSEQIKTAIQQRYPNTVVSLRVERKWIKTKVEEYGDGSLTATSEKAVRAYRDILDLLTKNGFVAYPMRNITVREFSND
jgi:hypothetical protein